jgi:tRNA modification GTPase
LNVNEAIAVSALTGAGLEDLRRRIYARTVERDAGAIRREQVAVNARQADALREADAALERIEGLAGEGAPAELLSVELRTAADALGRITGRSVAEDLIDAIFSRFCIGK